MTKREQIPHSDASRHPDELAQNMAANLERSSHPSFSSERPSIEAIIENWSHHVLPNIPTEAFVEPGWQSFWATTTGSDTPAARIRLGYSFIVKTDLKPEYHHLFDGDRTAQDAGTVKVNEMVALKIDTDTAFKLMEHFHHKEPWEFQKRTYSEVMQRAMDQQGNRTANVSDGYLDMEKDAQRMFARPNFSNL